MFVKAFLCLAWISLVSSGNLIQLPNGNFAITGKSCGISQEIKYLYHIPIDPSNLECILIQRPHGFVPKNNTKENSDSNSETTEEVCEFPAECEELKADGFCDEPCNNSACGFDGGDCCLAVVQCNPNFPVCGCKEE